MADELCLEDDGAVGIDWRTPDGDMLSVSLDSSGRVAYAVLLADGRSTHGTAEVAPEAFEVLRKLVHE